VQHAVHSDSASMNEYFIVSCGGGLA